VATPTYDFARGLDTLNRRVLFLTGSCSALNAAFQRRWHLPLFRQATLVEIPNTGHRLMVEAPQEFERQLRGFLSAYQP
jgi:pimeloyl-ACP methyl ester carboxylesterase